MAESTAPETSTQKFHLLSATYQSPTNEPFTHTQKLPAPPTSKTADRTTYLGALRNATAEMQEKVNKDLTSRMEEDKAREAGAKVNSKSGVDESKEEDNYGEEVPEED